MLSHNTLILYRKQPLPTIPKFGAELGLKLPRGGIQAISLFCHLQLHSWRAEGSKAVPEAAITILVPKKGFIFMPRILSQIVIFNNSVFFRSGRHPHSGTCVFNISCHLISSTREGIGEPQPHTDHTDQA